MQKKVLEISCYVAGAGAFGVFLRWLQDQLAFNDAGLPDPSAFHVMLPLYLLIAALVFRSFVKRFDKANLVMPEDFRAAFANEGKLYGFLRWVIGLVMIAGGLLLLMTSETDKYALMLRVLSLTAVAVGICFIALMTAANREKASPTLLCLFSFAPIFLYAVWLIYDYRANAINPVVWSYAMEVATVIMAMLAFFRVAGYAFNVPSWRRCFFDVMLGAVFCLTALADERYMGMHVILFASALMLLFDNWVMICNLRPGEEKKEEKKTEDEGGFEHL